MHSLAYNLHIVYRGMEPQTICRQLLLVCSLDILLNAIYCSKNVFQPRNVSFRLSHRQGLYRD